LKLNKLVRGKNGQFPFLATILSDNPTVDPTLHVLARKGHSEITISLNFHAMNFKTPGKTA
jgi:hypothetical protein